MNSDLFASPIEFIDITPYNPLISKCQIKVCWVGDQPNRNKSIITKEVAKGIANSIPGSPIVGYYNEETQDFEGHNKIIEIRNGKVTLKPTTKPYGFVDLNAKVWFQKQTDENGEHEYMVTEGWLWTGQFPECQRVIDKGNNHSMELDRDTISAHWTKDFNGKNEFFIINEAIMSKLCILGENTTPCFEGADITAPKIEFSFNEEFKNRIFSMMEEVKNNILQEGGFTKVEGEENKVLENAEENPVLENAAAAQKEEVCPDCGKPMSECVCKKTENACGEGGEKNPDKKDDEGKVAKYNLEEIPEYMELNNNYETVKKELEDLKANYSALEADNKALNEFKQTIEKAQKEDMIKSFYMLSDEDKKEVVEHINEYSLEDIEAKLSILCVRNKVSFEVESKTSEEEPLVYNLNNAADNTTENNPAWVNAVISRSKR